MFDREEYQKKYHKENRERYAPSRTASNLRKVNRNKRIVRDWLINHPCIMCGYSDVRALDFHHRNPSEKEHQISYLIRCASEERLLLEMKKCDILCKNCHSIHHWPDKFENID